MQSRATFSRYVYDLHERVNKMLKKVSGLTFRDVQDRYEHFRARCSRTTVKRGDPEKGCTEPLHRDAKARCVLKFVPQEDKCETFTVDPRCKFSKSTSPKRDSGSSPTGARRSQRLSRL